METITDEDIRKYILHLRLDKNMLFEEIAFKIGCSRGTIHSILHSRHPISAVTRARFTRAMAI